MALIAGALVLNTFGDYRTPESLIMMAAPVLLVGGASHGAGLISGARRVAQAQLGTD